MIWDKSIVVLFLWFGSTILLYAQPDFEKFRAEHPDNKFRYRILSFLEAETSETGWFSEDTPKEADLDSVVLTPPSYSEPGGLQFWGDLLNGKPNGYGLSLIKDRELRIGRFKAGLQTGFGYRLLADGTVYTGYFSENRPGGQGSIYFLKDSTDFQGNASLLLRGAIGKFGSYYYSKAVMSGRFSESNGTRIFTGIRKDYTFENEESNRLRLVKTKIGTWVNDRFTGFARIHLDLRMESAGSAGFIGDIHYFGQQENGSPKGKGILFTQYGEDKNEKSDTYEGIFDGNGMTNFTGKAVLADGTVVEGIFSALKAEGTGKVIKLGSTYEGGLKNGIPEGNGKLTKTDGTWYNGKWENGHAVFGELFIPELEETIKGSFVNGSPDGKMTVMRKDGSTGEVIYKDGVRQ